LIDGNVPRRARRIFNPLGVQREMAMATLRRMMTAVLAAGFWAIASASHAGTSLFTLTTAAVCAGNATGCGEVVPHTATCKRNCILTVQATAFTDWRFDHWEGGASGSANPTTVRMTSDTLVDAVFVRSTPPPPPPPPEIGHEVIGYFIQWGIYGRDYLVKDVAAAGAAKTLTVVNYAFAGIADDLTCTSLDTFADWGKSFDASESVDGIGDTATQPLKGNFNQLRKLKALYPQIRVLISIGGWSDSGRFSDAALTENRARFVTSCVNMFIKGQFAAGVTGPGVFDGIDIDWEYPGACGATCNFRPEDKANFTLLLQEFRGQLDEASPGRHLLLTAATPVAASYNDTIDLPGIAASIDWMNLMAYDFHGSWEPNGPTNHHANLYPDPADPSGLKLSVDGAVGGYLAKGADPSRIAIGIPFYGHGWSRVPDGGTHGLYQSAGSLPRGTWERGVEDYKVLKTKGYPEYTDVTAEASWLYNGSTFWSFDSPLAVRSKMHYIATRGLRGVMVWELSGDDGTLVGAIADCLASSDRCP
jgi:chitinase